MNQISGILRPSAVGICRAATSASSSTRVAKETTGGGAAGQRRAEDFFRFGPKEEYAFRTAQARARRGGGSPTTDATEVDKFRSMSSTWWDPDGWCRALHSMNELRVRLVTDGLVAAGRIGPRQMEEGPRPLEGLKVADVGCGGGILCEPLARLGARVTGLEPAEESLRVARDHALIDPEVADRVEYIPTPVEKFAEQAEGTFDAVIASEVLEHASDQRLFMDSCCRLASPRGGSVFVTTLNRTRESYLAGVLAAECLLGLLPVGTHDWRKFVTPEELQDMLRAGGCSTRLIHGMFYWPVFDKWTWIPHPKVNYALHAVKQ